MTTAKTTDGPHKGDGPNRSGGNQPDDAALHLALLIEEGRGEWHARRIVRALQACGAKVTLGSNGTLCGVKNGAVSCSSTNSNYSSANQGRMFQPAGLSSGVTDISTGSKICVVQNSAVKCWDDGDKNAPEAVLGL